MSGSPEFEVDLEDCLGLTELIASLGFAYLKLGQGLGSPGSQANLSSQIL